MSNCYAQVRVRVVKGAHWPHSKRRSHGLSIPEGALNTKLPYPEVQPVACAARQVD